MKGIFKKVLYAGIMCFVSSICCLGFAGCSNEQDNNQNHTPTWLSGTTNIQYVDYGENGDFYYDTDDYCLYQKENGEWVLKVENFGKPATADNIELRVSGGQIQWRYKTGLDRTWKKLIELSTLKGQSGYTPYIQDGYWYINGVNQNIPATGTSAKNIEIQKSTNAIQWRYVGDSNWNDLVSLSLIEGTDGSDGKSVKIAVNDSNIQWRYTDDSNDWQTIINVDSLKGSDGKTPHIDSVTGNWFIGNVDTGYRASAIDGREIVLQTTEDYIQWKYVGDNEWNNLIALSLLKGEDGATWLSGEIVPSTEGKNGDFYLNTSNYDVYKKQNDKWDKIGNIKASDGVGIKSIIKTSSEGLVDTYTITYTDNTTSTFSITNGAQGIQGIQGVPGKDGVGINVVWIDGTGSLNLQLSDCNILNLGKIVGNNGNGIEKIEKTSTVDNVDNYTISYSDGTTFEYSVVNGVNGKDGNDGENGKDGVGISSILKTSSNGLVDTYTITYTNNSTTTFNIVNGADGEKGEKGETGATGEKGETGNGIAKIEKEKSEDNIDTYKILFTNGSYTTFTITNGINGNGIKTIAKTSSNGLVDTYTINYTDGSYTTYTVTNGANGLSAYEIYKIYNPSYTKTEQEWIFDLVNGDLATNTYTVTFNSNGGSDVPAQSNIKYAGKATKPNTPTKTGYAFAGWFLEEEKWSFIGYSVTEDITLTAMWEPIKYKISFDTNGLCDFDSIELTVEDDLVLPVVDIEGYNYEWKVGENTISNCRWNIASDTTITLKLIPVEYTITYILEEGCVNNEANPTIYTIESDDITLLNPNKELYYFVGWYDNPQYSGEIVTKITTGSIGNKTYYAKFHNVVTVSLNANGGTLDTKTIDLIYGEEYSLPTPLAPDGYVFTEWVYNVSRDESGEIKNYTSLNTNTWRLSNIDELVAIYSIIFTYQGNTITGLTTIGKEQTSIVIPTQIDSVDITKINDSAFYNDTNLKSIAISDNIISIGSSTFSGCTSLSEVTIPNSVETIGWRAFSGCPAVQSLTIGENVKQIGNYAFAGMTKVETLNYNAISLNDFQEQYSETLFNGVFYNLGLATDSTVLNIGKNVVKIPAHIFNNPDAIPKITEINYADGCKIEEIGTCAFVGCPIKTITIPSTIKYLGKRAFCDLWDLTEIVFNAKELIYESTTNGNRNLYQVFAGAGKSTQGIKLFIGEDVEDLSRIFGCDRYVYPTKIITIDFSSNSKITQIPDNYFQDAYYIKTLILPKTIIRIGANAFYSESEKTHLETIYYCGNQTEFANIVVDNTDNGNKYFNTAKIYYYSEFNGDVIDGFDDYWYFENNEIKTWNPEKYTVTYVLDEDVINEGNLQQFTKYDIDINLIPPTKEGYVFNGWYEDADYTTPVTAINECRNYTLYAKWIKNEQ